MRNGEVVPVASNLPNSVLPESGSALCGLNADGCLTWVNEAFEMLVNCRREAVLGSPLAGLFEAAEQRGLAEVFARVLLDGERICGHQTRFRRTGGGTSLVQVSGMPVNDSSDDTTVVVALECIPEEQRLPASPAGALHEDSPLQQALVQTGDDGVCIHAGADLGLITGVEAEQLIGKPLMSALHPECRVPELIAVATQFNGEPSTWRGSVLCNGDAEMGIPAMMQANQLVDASGRFAGVSACFWQMPGTASETASELKDTVGQYRLDARLPPGQMVYDYDVSSGEVQWNGAILQLTGERPERFRGTDLNAWEQRIHPEDRPLIMERLRQALESGSRYRAHYRLRRGDGFYLRVEERATVLRNVRGVAYRMLGSIRLLSTPASDVTRMAVNSLDRPEVRDPLAEEESGWVERISQALKEDRLRLYFQRTFRLDEGEAPERAEIFLRMLDEQGEPLAASTFLPPAIRCNLMPLLDRWVIRQVCTKLAEQKDPSQSVSVNLAPGSLMDGRFADFVEQQLKENGLKGSVLAFEIVESAVATSGAVTGFMRRMRELGSRIILDNVGGGLCSLGYLRGLPVDAFKIDGGFMRHLDDPVDLAIVESIAKVAGAMNVSLMVQGVEDRRVLEVLRHINVQTVQGRALHAPEPWE